MCCIFVYGHEVWFLKLWEEQRLSVCENAAEQAICTRGKGCKRTTEKNRVMRNSVICNLHQMLLW